MYNVKCPGIKTLPKPLAVANVFLSEEMDLKFTSKITTDNDSQNITL